MKNNVEILGREVGKTEKILAKEKKLIYQKNNIKKPPAI